MPSNVLERIQYCVDKVKLVVNTPEYNTDRDGWMITGYIEEIEQHLNKLKPKTELSTSKEF